MSTNVLRSTIVTQVTRGGRSVVSRRNFPSRRRSKGKVICYVPVHVVVTGPPLRVKIIQRIGFAMGLGTGYYFHGHYVARLEEKRQQLVNEYLGHPYATFDLREQMWPNLKKKTEPARRLWSGIKEKIWTGRAEEMWSDLSRNVDSAWSDLRGNVDSAWSDLSGNMGTMWSDVREKMSSDRES